MEQPNEENARIRNIYIYIEDKLITNKNVAPNNAN